ncbi:hypothetical protein COT75_01680 [Candidatus Beckwithbacteria bacterium CG10_big_fil_rev_8_21_14_0_10_34_10]|uniref:Glycosyltransferase RgtA/B/C/D-like domain-containing protein n=1 Tax=Candidatus Beckwithbacteria bacterium CG10_big_fil_rev_8_21_14_0_10_34_10 TaxID=1974495 RepID=A0A2H0WBR1_9BACT|nr:MAG: hypothetical protein COT75_01680 [Candidatus Beckwithbacteria bacterium CG10_big_fil_rev_8_21_14_0_10_34_10]
MNKKVFCFLSFAFLTLLIGYFIIYKNKFVKNPIRADAAGYYSYLPAFFIYKDFGLSKTDLYLPDAKSLKYPAIYYLNETGKNINKYSLGVALLISPFFLLGHLVSLAFSLPLTGYTMIYQHFVGLGAIFYLLLGLFFLLKLYQKYYSKNVVVLTLVSLLLATNLFHYATFDSLMSHVFSFSLISGFLYFLDNKNKKNPKELNLKNSILGGILLGLIFLVRNSNLIIGLLLFPLIKKKNFKSLLFILFSFLIVCLPQFLYWHYVSGSFFLFSYKGEGFNFLSPKIFKTLFSVRKGLFFWAPVFFLGLLGIKGLKEKFKALFFPFLGVIFLFIYLISSWYDWSFGASFGNRAFIDIYPILSLFLGSGLERIVEKIGDKKTWVFLSFFIILNLTNMFKYWQRILPYDQVSLEIYLKNLFVLIK